MSRYIDADAILKHKCDVYDINDHVLHAVPTGHIISAPSIDIVRCKECKHRTDSKAKSFCEKWLREVDAEVYCSYGQKGDENVETD